MVAVENHIVKYFRAPKDHFWHWTDGGTVIAWANGNTICYRDDLLTLLQQVNSGLPPLSPLLLLLTACARPLHIQDVFFLHRHVKEFAGNDENNSLHKTLKYALKFLEIISALPPNLRTGQKRVHLIHEVFTGGEFVFRNSQVRDTILELNSGRMDNDVFNFLSEKITEGDFINCLLYFCSALQKYPTVESLTIKLRTGVDQLPVAAPALIPASDSGSLYDQLLENSETAGIARLAKRLTAALNIPMQSKGSSEQPFGGISDITNRGNYDKLLLSELAHDDELLMARLVNNEALYFRREEPPENPKMQRIILMDTTLKMWGTSRLFALACGLACARQNKHVELLEAYCLGGEKFTPVSLSSKHGVIQALEMLDPALHCGIGLEAAISSTQPSVKNEFIFITHNRLLHHPAFYASLAKVKQMISFVITVTDTGELQLYEYINGISKLISNAKIDVDDLLVATRKPKAKGERADLPAFLLQKPAPLYFPPIRIKTVPEKIFVPANLELEAIAINETQRVFMRVHKDKAAVELLSYIEKGNYTFGLSSDNWINILVNNVQRKLLKLYKINPDSLEVQVIDLPAEMGTVTNSAFNDNKFYIEAQYGAYAYDCIACVVVEKKLNRAFDDLIARIATSNMAIFKKYEFYKFFDQYSSVFYKIKTIHINSTGKLVLGKHELVVNNKIYISFKENYNKTVKAKDAQLAEESLNLVKNKSLAFNVWKWDDGSEAIIDPRGFVHLKSSNQSLPEITLIMVLGRSIACWTSDNNVCGSDYYINEKITTKKTAEVFYNDYIQKFIDRLV